MSIKGLHESVVGGLARPREIHCYAIRVDSLIDGAGDELGAIVAADYLRHAATNA